MSNLENQSRGRVVYEECKSKIITEWRRYVLRRVPRVHHEAYETLLLVGLQVLQKLENETFMNEWPLKRAASTNTEYKRKSQEAVIDISQALTAFAEKIVGSAEPTFDLVNLLKMQGILTMTNCSFYRRQKGYDSVLTKSILSGLTLEGFLGRGWNITLQNFQIHYQEYDRWDQLMSVLTSQEPRLWNRVLKNFVDYLHFRELDVSRSGGNSPRDAPQRKKRRRPRSSRAFVKDVTADKNMLSQSLPTIQNAIRNNHSSSRRRNRSHHKRESIPQLATALTHITENITDNMDDIFGDETEQPEINRSNSHSRSYSNSHSNSFETNGGVDVDFPTRTTPHVEIPMNNNTFVQNGNWDQVNHGQPMGGWYSANMFQNMNAMPMMVSPHLFNPQNILSPSSETSSIEHCRSITPGTVPSLRSATPATSTTSIEQRTSNMALEPNEEPRRHTDYNNNNFLFDNGQIAQQPFAMIPVPVPMYPMPFVAPMGMAVPDERFVNSVKMEQPTGNLSPEFNFFRDSDTEMQ